MTDRGGFSRAGWDLTESELWDSYTQETFAVPREAGCPCGVPYLTILSACIGDTPAQARERYRQQHYDELRRRYIHGDDAALAPLLDHVSLRGQ